MNTQQVAISDEASDLILFLENTRTFYEKWVSMAESVIPAMFTASSKCRKRPSILFFTAFNKVSFSHKEMLSGHLADIIRSGAKEARLEGIETNYESQSQTQDYFMTKLINKIQSGEIEISPTLSETLTSLYVDNKGNIAKTCRDLNLSRHFVNKAAGRMSKDAFFRYQKVQLGTPYHIVMGDCAPYVQDHPLFNPVYVAHQDGSHRAIQQGDLVAEIGSSRWHTVAELGESSGLVFCDSEMGQNGPILHTPCRVLPNQYANNANRLCN